MRRPCAGTVLSCVVLLAMGGTSTLAGDEAGAVDPLPGTKPLTWTDDIASRLVAGVDRFLLREIDRSAEGRVKFWKRDTSSVAGYSVSIEPNRKRLAHILGVRDPRVAFDAPELVETTDRPALVGRGAGFEAFAIRWPAFGDVHGEGLLLVPTGRVKVADVVAIPDADRTPEQVAGLAQGVAPDSQFARRLAESGCRVLVPALIDPGHDHPFNSKPGMAAPVLEANLSTASPRRCSICT